MILKGQEIVLKASHNLETGSTTVKCGEDIVQKTWSVEEDTVYPILLSVQMED